jgi:hypothetical protein
MMGALAAAATLLFLFGELGSLVERNWRLQVRLPSAPGLRAGSLVTMHGVPVGRIKAVEFLAEPRMRSGRPTEHRDRPRHGRALHQGRRRGPLELRGPHQGVAARRRRVARPGPKEGEAKLRSEAPAWSASNLPPKDGVLYGRSQGIEERLLASVKPLLEDLKPLSAEYKRLGENLNSLLEPTKPGGEAPAPDSIRAAIASLQDAIKKVDEFATSANKLVEDPELLFEPPEHLGELRHRAPVAHRDAQRIPGTRRARSTRWRGSAHARGDPRRVRRVREARVGSARRQGHDEQLVQDPVMHESLVELVRHFDETLQELSRMIETMRSEGVSLSERLKRRRTPPRRRRASDRCLKPRLPGLRRRRRRSRSRRGARPSSSASAARGPKERRSSWFLPRPFDSRYCNT